MAEQNTNDRELYAKARFYAEVLPEVEDTPLQDKIEELYLLEHALAQLYPNASFPFKLDGDALEVMEIGVEWDKSFCVAACVERVAEMILGEGVEAFTTSEPHPANEDKTVLKLYVKPKEEDAA